MGNAVAWCHEIHIITRSLWDLDLITGSVVKNLLVIQETQEMQGSIPGLGRFPGEGNGNPIQYSSLGNLMDRGAWWATVHGVAKSRKLLK